MLLPPLSYRQPKSLSEAVALLDADPSARVLAGGQTLINALKLGATEVSVLVDINRVPELKGISVSSDGALEIGAGVTHDEIQHNETVHAQVPVVAHVAAGLVDQQVRCRGTIGGNCCLNDPASNFPPLLIALGATMHLATSDGAVDLEAESFFGSSLATAARDGAVLQRISIPATGADERVGYGSVQIAEDSWALARSVVWLRGESEITDARVVFGCLAGGPARASLVEEALIGSSIGPDLPQAALEALKRETLPTVTDAHGTSEYRRTLASEAARRALHEAIESEGVGR